MPVVGPVADRVKGLIPITWDALERDPRVGDGPLQAAVNLAKQTVTGNVTPSSQEQNYPLIVIDYIAKIATIEIIPAGVDFWMNQSQSISSSGTNENLSYTDRANQLENRRNDLIQETRDKYTEVAKMIGYWSDNGRAVPQLSSANINPFHLTPSPEEFPRPYKQTQYS